MRILLLRRLNQSFWLLLLMGLTTWGAWRFCILLAPSVTRPLVPAHQELHTLHSQHLESLDSSVTALRLAVITGQPEAVLLEMHEQIRQLAQEVTLLSVSEPRRKTALQTPLLDQCLAFKRLLILNAPAPALSQHLATLQSQVRYQQFLLTLAPSN
ncbi:hypothetical protein ACO2Q8_02255 [Larkinella sp. VNQ87]|uniref:hypothetical protein n=1 Tax=Larkinella sp. VNQ87 TaxID=3400921 RepID=UPI003C007B80